MTSDFETVLNDLPGINVRHVPVTTGKTNKGGDEFLTDGTEATIKVYFLRTVNKRTYEKSGFIKVGDALLLSKYSDSLKFNDKIKANGIRSSISTIDGNATTISITTSAAHGLSAGDLLIIIGTTNYDGSYTVATAPTTTTLTITDNSHDVAAETSGEIDGKYKTFRVKEALNRRGPDEAGTSFTYQYTACNLFLEADANDD